MMSTGWKFVSKPRPHGLGIDERLRPVEGFLIVFKGLREQEKLAMGMAVYTACRIVAQARSCGPPLVADKLLHLHTEEALRGSRANKDIMTVG